MVYEELNAMDRVWRMLVLRKGLAPDARSQRAKKVCDYFTEEEKSDKLNMLSMACTTLI